MLITAALIFWFFSGLVAIHLAFAAARKRQEVFDPVHIWLALLGPVSLVFVCLSIAGGKDPAEYPGRLR